MFFPFSGRRLAGGGLVSCLTAAFVVCSTGCDRYEYNIKLKPTAGGLERTLELKSARKRLFGLGIQYFGEEDRPEVERIAKIYEAAVPKALGKAVPFAGKVFAAGLPQDIGGAGHYVRYDSPLGSSFLYTERIRGNDDLHTQGETRRKAVDTVVDHLVGWFESELKNEPGWPGARDFLDKTLRRDLHNFSIYVSPAEVASMDESTPPDPASTGAFVRGYQYLVERGYVTYEEIPAIMRIVNRGGFEISRKQTLDWIRKKLVQKWSSSQPAIGVEQLAFLDDPEAAAESWKRYFEKTEYFEREKAKRIAEIDAEETEQLKKDVELEKTISGTVAATKKGFQHQRESIADNIVGTALMSAFIPSLKIGVDNYTISLELSDKPVVTNGEWKADEKRVVWNGKLLAVGDNPLPTLDLSEYCFALWDQPNVEGQRQLFGETAIRGSELSGYCIWFQSLTADEQRQWNEFLPTLKPDRASRNRLEAFHFASEPASTNELQSAAKSGIDIIMKVINQKIKALK